MLATAFWKNFIDSGLLLGKGHFRQRPFSAWTIDFACFCTLHPGIVFNRDGKESARYQFLATRYRCSQHSQTLGTVLMVGLCLCFPRRLQTALEATIANSTRLRTWGHNSSGMGCGCYLCYGCDRPSACQVMDEDNGLRQDVSELLFGG